MECERVVPFLKVDKGLAAEDERRAGDEADARARRRCSPSAGDEGHLRNQDALGDPALPTQAGIAAVVKQQFEAGSARLLAVMASCRSSSRK